MSRFMNPHVPVCRIFVQNNDLLEIYQERANAHNEKVNTSLHTDSGFDLLQPKECELSPKSFSNKLGLGVVAAVFSDEKPMPFYLYPRSSISKTPMRMCNSVGIIDSGYRGELIAMVDAVKDQEFIIKKGERYFQICMGDLTPFYVDFVDSLENLGFTERGSGGFGSTS